MPLISEHPEQVIRLADGGPDASGRERAREFREAIDFQSDRVVIDCENLESMSPSFADEFFGKLVEAKQRPSASVVNVPEDIAPVIRFAISERRS